MTDTNFYRRLFPECCSPWTCSQIPVPSTKPRYRHRRPRSRGRSRPCPQPWEPRAGLSHSTHSRPRRGRRATIVAEGVHMRARNQAGRVRAFSFSPIQSNSRVMLTGPLPPPSAVHPSPSGDGFSLIPAPYIFASVSPYRRRNHGTACGGLLRPQPPLPAAVGTPGGLSHSTHSRPRRGRGPALAGKGVLTCVRNQAGRVRAFSFSPLQSNSRAMHTGPLPPPLAVHPSPSGDGFSLECRSLWTHSQIPVPSTKPRYRHRRHERNGPVDPGKVSSFLPSRPQPPLPVTVGTPDEAAALNTPPSPLGLVMGCRPAGRRGVP